MRLDKYLAEAAQLPRSEARDAVRKGTVMVNGVVCRKADANVGEADTVLLQGKPLTHETFVYLMLNKPQGVVSAATDARDVTVVDLVKKDFPRRALFPAGRLDKTSTGFVLLTDDGNFAHDILAPKHHVDKTYIVTLDAPFTQEIARGFAEGVTLADGTLCAAAEIAPVSADGLTVRIVLHQGVYHQIKRMLGTFGVGVNALHREAIGGVALDAALQPGQYRRLTEKELQKLGK